MKRNQNDKSDSDSIILHQKKLINKQKEFIELLQKHIKSLKELNNFLETKSSEFYKGYRNEVLNKYKDADLMAEAFLIQNRRKMEKDKNKKLKRFTDFQAILHANERLKKYRIEDLVFTPFDINRRIAPKDLLIKIQQNFSRSYKDRFKREAGKYLSIILALEESPINIFPD